MDTPSSSRCTRVAMLIEYRRIYCSATGIYQWYVSLEQILLLFSLLSRYVWINGYGVAHPPSVEGYKTRKSKKKKKMREKENIKYSTRPHNAIMFPHNVLILLSYVRVRWYPSIVNVCA